MTTRAADRWLPLPVAIAIGALLLLTTWLLFVEVNALGTGARLTARLSFTFFIAAYWAQPLVRCLSRTESGARRFARWLLANRRWLGIGGALSQGVHLAYVVGHQLAHSEPLDWVTLVFGGLGFVAFWVMGVTSNNTAVRRMGRDWSRLHSVSLHYLWFIFFITYLGRGLDPLYTSFTALLVGGLALRLITRLPRFSRER
ncbi:MAG: hypothetical protein AAF515_19090 [Pseudomonadota bacterium]